MTRSKQLHQREVGLLVSMHVYQALYALIVKLLQCHQTYRLSQIGGSSELLRASYDYSTLHRHLQVLGIPGNQAVPSFHLHHLSQPGLLNLADPVQEFIMYQGKQCRI